jgi:hypothetical protein
MMKKYRMYLQIDGQWSLIRTIEAPDHCAALRKAIASIQPAHYDKPLRLEQDTGAQPEAPYKPGETDDDARHK